MRTPGGAGPALWLSKGWNPGPALSFGDISTVAGDNNFGYTGNGGPATSAELNNPSGVAFDSAGGSHPGPQPSLVPTLRPIGRSDGSDERLIIRDAAAVAPVSDHKLSAASANVAGPPRPLRPAPLSSRNRPPKP